MCEGPPFRRQGGVAGVCKPMAAVATQAIWWHCGHSPGAVSLRAFQAVGKLPAGRRCGMCEGLRSRLVPKGGGFGLVVVPGFGAL